MSENFTDALAQVARQEGIINPVKGFDIPGALLASTAEKSCSLFLVSRSGWALPPNHTTGWRATRSFQANTTVIGFEP